MKIKLGSTSERVLALLENDGPADAGTLGAIVWRKLKRARVVSSHGGGDRAMQGLLGKLKKAGFVYITNTPGSSVWDITGAGRNALAKTT